MVSPRNRTFRVLWRALLLGFLLGGSSWRVFTILPSQASAAQSAHTAPVTETKESWMGVYMGTRKIGYMSVRTVPTTFHNQPAIRSVTSGVTKLELLGRAVEQEQREVTVSDAQYNPLEQTFDINSNGSALHVEATYDYAAHRITCRIGQGSDVTTKTLEIPKGAILSGDTDFLTQGKQFTAGQKVSLYSLNPVSVELDENTVEIGGQETLKDGGNGKPVGVRVVTAQTALGQVRSWETAGGDMLKAEMNLGGIRMLMLKEPPATALNFHSTPSEALAGGKEANAYTPPADFAIATAIATDRPIARPRNLRSLHVTIAGVPDKKLILSDPRQKEAILPGANGDAGYTVQVEINAAAFDPANSVELPVTNAELAPYLKKAAYLDTGDANILRTALRLRGQEKNAYRVACRIRDWVHQNMTPDPSIGVPRSATDIFGRRRGVCRDYATLYTALARAAGIPTRLCGGIVYSEGKFFYHAWAESYVGQWVAFDPTLYDPADGADYVDATHIKFAQGDVTSMYDFVSVVGKLRITVQDASS